MAAMVVV
jgi:hypothetical protein